MKLAIVIVNYNTSGDLERCLESLTAYPPNCAHEIVVVDNASSEPGLAAVQEKHPAVRWILNSENLGYARGANLGLGSIQAAYYLVLNPDIVAQPGAIDSLLAFADSHPKAGIIGPQLLNEDGSVQDSCRRFYTFKTLLLRRTLLGKILPRSRTVDEHLMRDFDHASVRPVDWVLGGCLLVRRSALERTGPMDERFFLYFEDVDWCYRMWQAGYEVLYTPDARFAHRHRRDSAKGALHRGFWLHLTSLISFYEKWGMLVYLVKRWREPLVVFLLWAVDMLALWGAFLLAYGLRYLANPLFPAPLFPLSAYRSLLLFASLLTTLTFLLAGRYRVGRRRQATSFAARLQQVGTVSLLLLASTYLGRQEAISRAVLLLFVPIFAVMTALGEDLFRALRRRLERGYFSLERTLLVGDPARLQRWLDRIRDCRRLGIDPVGYVAEPPAAGDAALPPLGAGEVPWLGRWTDLIETVKKWRISQVVFWRRPTLDTLSGHELVQLRRLRIRIRWRIDDAWLVAAGARPDSFGGEVSALLEPGTGSWLHSLLVRLLSLASGCVVAVVAALPYVWLRWRRRPQAGDIREVTYQAGLDRTATLRLVCQQDGTVRPLLWQWPLAVGLLRGQLDVWGDRLRLGAETRAALDPATAAAFWRGGSRKPGLTGPWAGVRSASGWVHLPADDDHDATFSFATSWFILKSIVATLVGDPGGIGRVPPLTPPSSPGQPHSRSPGRYSEHV